MATPKEVAESKGFTKGRIIEDIDSGRVGKIIGFNGGSASPSVKVIFTDEPNKTRFKSITKIKVKKKNLQPIKVNKELKFSKNKKEKKKEEDCTKKSSPKNTEVVLSEDTEQINSKDKNLNLSGDGTLVEYKVPDETVNSVLYLIRSLCLSSAQLQYLIDELLDDPVQ